MIKLFKSIYNGKKVLVTGHTGFKGSWLCLWLKQLGADVIGYSLNPNTNPSFFKVLNIESEITSIIGDIRDEKYLNDTIQKYKPEIVFHLAAQPLVRLSYLEPKNTYETNVIGTLNLFESVIKSDSVNAIVNITTDKCYENKEWIYGYREIDPMGGYDPYSSSKGCVELLTNSYRQSFFNDLNISVASVRAGNVIGGGDWAEDRLVPDIARSISQNKVIVTRNPMSTRPWQYVLEPLSGYLWIGALMLQKHNNLSEGWNFGPNYNDILSVEEVIKKSIGVWGRGNYTAESCENQLHEANLLKLDISKAKAKLKWRPVYDSNRAIEETINWYKEFYENEKFNAKEFSINQIKEYTKVAISKNIIWSE
ncbi:CDP-glucose 4,6-dehydratase [Romboutsia sp.]|uniref:CDP-glucose 4,6-dehydratase n=1 Tax=Romboutsia sp. TaxID=1965302 RepID=UPI003F337432